MRPPSVRDYLPATRAGRVFAGISLINAMGTGLFIAGSAIFFSRSVGLSTGEIGLALTLAGLVGFLATVPIGALSDRLGAKRTLVALLLWRSCWFAALVLVDGFGSLVLVACCLAAAEGATQPMTQAVSAATTEESDRTRMMAIVRTVRNIGFSLGALLAAPLLAADSVWTYRGLVLGTAAAFLLSGLLLAGLRLLNHRAAPRKMSPLAAVRGFRDLPYLAFSGLNGVLVLHMTILTIGIPLWALEATEVPAAFVPVLILVNTVLAILIQVPLSRKVNTPPGATRSLRRGGLALAACCLALAAAALPSSVMVAAGLLMLGCLLLTFGEVWQAAGAWELSYTYAPEDRMGTYLSVFGLGAAGQRIVGPMLISGLVIATGPLGWTGLAVLFLLAGLLVRPATGALARGAAAAPSAPGPVVPEPAAPEAVVLAPPAGTRSPAGSPPDTTRSTS